MNKSIIPGAGVILALILLAACNLPTYTPTGGGADPAADTQTAIESSIRQTLTAADPGGSLPESTLEFTSSPTPEVPHVSVSVATNCRSGPGTVYDMLGALQVGQVAEVIGRNASSDTWIIRLPSDPDITCWLWGNYASVVGDTSSLPVYTPPPTPTPSAGFSFAYNWFGVGPGFQCIMFDVTNTGSLTWQSFSLTLENLSDGGAWTSFNDQFLTYDGWCMVTNNLQDLEPGEAGTASVLTFMPGSFAGDHYRAELKLCTADGLSGTCLTKTIDTNFP